MTSDERRKFSETLLRELQERLGGNDNFRRQLEGFSSLPAGRVADRLARQFESLLSAQMIELLVDLVEQDIRSEREIADAMREQEERAEQRRAKLRKAREAEATRAAEAEARRAEEERRAEAVRAAEGAKAATADRRPAAADREDARKAPEPAPSIMEHFGTRESFPTAPMDIPLAEEDWLYLYAFCYAPETSGKGVPAKKLQLKGFDRKNEVFLLDYGDIRFFVSRVSAADYIADKGGRPTIDPQHSVWYRYDHEKLVNTLRTAEVVVPLNPWTIFRGLGEVNRMIEDRYVDLLRTLIDAHDATEWEVEVFGFDDHIIRLPSITQEGKVRSPERESRHAPSKARDVKHVERLIFREKTIAQEIHSSLLYYAQRGKLDHMIRLDSAFMNDWKSILVCRYTVPKDRRRKFCEGINAVYETYGEFQLMLRVINPSAVIRLGER